MGDILNIQNLNNFIGRYKKSNKGVEKYIGWLAEDGLYEKFPILSLRNRNRDDDEWPHTWAKNRNLRIAVRLVGDSLSGWQAYRPSKSEKVIKRLCETVPGIIIDLNKQFVKHSVYSADDLSKRGNDKIVNKINEAVCKISTLKKSDSPMLGSKVLHHFFPEIIPVYDTMWIANKSLKGRKIGKDYKKYMEFMIEEIRTTKKREIRKIENVYIKHTTIPKQVVNFHFHRLTPIIFEACLLGTISI